ncbi:MAG: L,D-transpeptidase family protein [Rhodospirillales bacterium]|nr:L,D-transpeptidase family protein [Rhodospirillales bacterium]
MTMKIRRTSFFCFMVIFAAMGLIASVGSAHALTTPEAKPVKSATAPASPAPRADFSAPYIGKMQFHTATQKDSLVYLARDFNLGFVELRAANPEVDPWLPGAGTRVLLPTMHLLPRGPREGIVINLPEMRLYAWTKPDRAPLSFPIGIGREGLNTPTGTTQVMQKIDGPIWRPTKRMREEDPELPEAVPQGPENPLGTHALYLGWNEYRIHGTNKPFGIGRRSSSGCIRMYPEGIVDLYHAASVGESVTVLNQPVKAAWVGKEFYLEAHPTIEQADEMEQTGTLTSYRLSEDDMRLILAVAGDDSNGLDWDLIRGAVQDRRGYPVVVGWRDGARPKTNGPSLPMLDAARPREVTGQKSAWIQPDGKIGQP